MSHHYSGPDFGFPHGDARLDFTDLFVFPKAGDCSKTILIMDVHPSVGFNPPGPTTTEPFATYEVMLDTDGDAVVNIAFSVRFSASDGGGQSATVRRIVGTRFDRKPDDGEDGKSAYLAAGAGEVRAVHPPFAHSLEHAGGYTPEEATRAAATLLPDMLRINLPPSLVPEQRPCVDR